MNKLFLFAFLIFTSEIFNAQELVPNGSFENSISCPNGFSQLSNASPWFNPTSLSPDYFHACALETQLVGVPTNLLGFQEALTGEAYSGIYASQISAVADVREYISIPLTEPLEADTSYLLEFYVNLSNSSQYGISTMGAYFSADNSFVIDEYMIVATPQITYSDGAITDTTEWVLVSGHFSASGGEQYLTIGNFANDEESGLEFGVGGNENAAYYYIEDVSLTKFLLVGMDGDPQITVFDIFPNPVGNILQFENPFPGNHNSTLIVFEMSGREVLRSALSGNGITEVDINMLAAGSYIAELTNGKQVAKSYFIKP